MCVGIKNTAKYTVKIVLEIIFIDELPIEFVDKYLII